MLFKDELGPAIKDYLQRCMEPPQVCLFWSLYMRGHHIQTARPYLVFSSTDGKKRKIAMKLVRDSGILTSIPALRLRHTRYPPDMNAPMRLLGDQVRDQSQDTAHTSAKNGFFYCRPSENTLGVSVFVGRLPSEGGLRRATAGGIICIGSRFFYLTVSHVLEQNEEPRESIHDYDSLIEDDEGSEEEVEDEDADLHFDDSILAESGVLSTPSSYVSQYSEASESLNETRYGSRAISRLHDEILLFQVRKSRQLGNAQFNHSDYMVLGPPYMIGSQELDYVLIEIHDKSLIRPTMLPASQIPFNNISVDNVAEIGNEDREVAILTASRGALRGTLFATPRFMSLPKAPTIRKAFSVRLDRRIQSGDCGSWVVDATTGHFYGHIFGGGAGTRTAYIISATEILDEIQTKYAQPVCLPSAADEHAQSLPQIPGDELHRRPEVSHHPNSPDLLETRTPKDEPMSTMNRKAEKKKAKWPGDNSSDTKFLAKNASRKLAATDRIIESITSDNLSEASKNYRTLSISHSSPEGEVNPEFLEDNKARSSISSELLSRAHPQVSVNENKVSRSSYTSKPDRHPFFRLPSSFRKNTSKQHDKYQVDNIPVSDQEASFAKVPAELQTSQPHDIAQMPQR